LPSKNRRLAQNASLPLALANGNTSQLQNFIPQAPHEADKVHIPVYVDIYLICCDDFPFSAVEEFYLACEVVASNDVWHPCRVGRALCRVMLPILRWPQAHSNVGKLPWQRLPCYQADGLWASMWTHRRWAKRGAAQPVRLY